MDDDRIPAWRRYLRFWRTDVRGDVDEEIEFHLQGLIDEYVAQGMTRDEASRLALRRFGDRTTVAGTMKALAEQREHTMERTEWLTGLGRDLRFGWRQLAKRPGFTAVAILTLALGIGANTAMFSAVKTVLLRPIAAEDLDRIVFIYDNLPRIDLDETPLDPPQVLALGEQGGEVLETSGAELGGSAVLTGAGEPRRLARGRTMGGVFDVFGVRAHIGRLYRPDESENGQHRVAVLAYDFWRELGGEPSVVGSMMTLNGEAFQVVGVMQPDFRYPRGAQYWSPYPVTPETRQAGGRLIMTTVAKLKQGATLQQLDVLLDALAKQSNPGAHRRDFFMSARDFVSAHAGQLRPTLVVLLAAVGFVLLIACANVASLQLVHGAARAREMLVRAAMGASRWNLVRQLMVENLVLSVAGGTLGILVGLALLKILSAAGAAQLPALERLQFDGLVLAFAAAATIMSGLLFGLAPALRAGRVDLHEG